MEKDFPTENDLQELVKKYDFRQFAFMQHTSPAATWQQIEKTESELGVIIPDIYKAFLLYSDGASIDYAWLCDLGSIVSQHDVLNMAQYLPGYLCIASENGDYELIMESKADATTVYLVSAGSMLIDEHTTTLPSLYQWLLSGNGDDPGDPFHMYDTDDDAAGCAGEDRVDIVLTERPSDGTKGFAHLKRALNLPVSAAYLFLQCKVLPYVLVENCKREQAERMLTQLADRNIVKLVDKSIGMGVSP